ncbi:MAG: 4-hydroxy-tetrahydrodipicolinate reductase [Deltaproteobacteria bacterium]|jgi:4-hydroxy-tetrahydrodipicolinate reductase|nr:4-hydroxy-tetrahydrodipicolinate reductase [Deltaproteobacteria bacterium]
MADKTKIMVAGAAGRMGRRLMELIHKDPDLELVGALERPDSPDLGKDLGELCGVGTLGIKLTASFPEAAKGAKVYLDFSSPMGVSKNIVDADVLGLAAVIGVTAIDDVISTQLREASQRLAILVAPNMSTGVNLLYRLASLAAESLGDAYDIEIVEAHHNRKKDAPSGTAMKLYETLCKARSLDPDKAHVFGRSGTPGPRGKDEIGIMAVRGGDIIGEHTVIFAGPGEVLELTHRAQTRDAFAEGALKAAKWIATREPGYYSYGDVLGS